MALSGVWDAIQGKLSFLVNDEEVAEAANNCYAALCYNRGFGVVRCPLKLEHIGHIIWGYINYFITNPDQNAKYYFDEARDRSDPYRKALVERIGQTVSRDAEFTNEVLSYLYWGIKRGKVAKGILRPREVAKFHNSDYWYKGVWGGLFKITVELTRFAEQILKKLGYVISKSSQAVADVVETVGNVVAAAGNVVKTVGNVVTNTKYLPYILGAAAAGFVGFQVYKFKKTGEFFLGIKN
jgi:hypothetical protein